VNTSNILQITTYTLPGHSPGTYLVIHINQATYEINDTKILTLGKVVCHERAELTEAEGVLCRLDIA